MLVQRENVIGSLPIHTLVLRHRPSPARKPKPSACCTHNPNPMQQQELFQKTKYSRIPVYDGQIDNIIGVAMSKVRVRLTMKLGWVAAAVSPLGSKRRSETMGGSLIRPLAYHVR